MKIDAPKMYWSLSVEEKRKMRESMEELDAARKAQIQEIERNIVQLLRDCIEAGKRFKANEIPWQQYVYVQKKASMQVNGFFKLIKRKQTRDTK